MRAPGLGGLLPGCGASGVGRSPTPHCPSLGPAAGARCPLAVGAGVWAWGPITNPTARALVSWLCAPWGQHQCARGGAPLGWVWGVRGRALSHARPPVLGACCRGPLPTGCGCGGFACGDPSPIPHGALLLAGFAFCGHGTGAPGGGRLLSGCGASGVRRSPTPDRPSLGRAAGARYPLAVGAGDVGLGTHQQPHWARSCQLVLRAVGAAPRRPGAWGVWGAALSHAQPPVLGACGWGPLPTGCGRGPTARALACWLCVLLGRHQGAQGGAYRLGVGRLGLGTLPCPTAHPWVMRPGSASPWLWVRGLWAWEPVTNPTARALQTWPCVLWGRQEVDRGGGLSCLGVGRPGLAALPRPTARPWGVRPGPATNWLWAPGVWAWGLVTNPTARTLACWLCLRFGRHEGARGGASCLDVGCPR